MICQRGVAVGFVLARVTGILLQGCEDQKDGKHDLNTYPSELKALAEY